MFYFFFTSIYADFGSQGIEHRKGSHKLSENPLCYKRSFIDFFSPSYQHNRSGRRRCHLLFFCDIFMRLNWVLKRMINRQEPLSLCGVGVGGNSHTKKKLVETFFHPHDVQILKQQVSCSAFSKTQHLLELQRIAGFIPAFSITGKGTLGPLLSAPAVASKRETPTSNLTESTAPVIVFWGPKHPKRYHNLSSCCASWALNT